jgi:hypothetical protein
VSRRNGNGVLQKTKISFKENLIIKSLIETWKFYLKEEKHNLLGGFVNVFTIFTFVKIPYNSNISI